MTIEIQHGCYPHPQFDNAYIYVESINEANRSDYEELLKIHQTEVQHSFVTDSGEQPEIGDFIEGGKLVKRTKPKVNADWTYWKDKDLYGNP